MNSRTTKVNQYKKKSQTNTLEDVLAKSKDEFVTPKPAKMAKLERHPCSKCTKVFHTNQYLSNHFALHHSKSNSSETKISQNDSIEITFQCYKCPETFKDKESVGEHSIMKHSKISCDVCEKEFAEILFLREHFSNAHLAEAVQCDKCEKLFFDKNSFNDHYFINHGKVNCSSCDETFTYTEFNEHFDKRKECGHCKKTICNDYEHELDDHIKEMHPQFSELIPLQCDLCQKTFKCKELQMFKEHYESKHKMDDQTQCRICEETFDEPKDLRLHLNEEFKGNEKCDFCGRLFLRPCGKVTHMKNCHKKNHFALKKVHKCIKCNHNFHILQDLEDMRFRTTIRNTFAYITCWICEKFTSKDINEVCNHNKTCQAYICKFCLVKCFTQEQMCQHLQDAHQKLVEAQKEYNPWYLDF